MGVGVASRAPAVQFLCYGMVSGVAMLVDLAVFAGVWRLSGIYVASFLSFVAGVFVAYVGSQRFVFDPDCSIRGWHGFLMFAAVGVLGVMLTEALLWLLVDAAELPAVPSRAIIFVPVFLFNFILRRRLMVRSA